MRRKMVKTPRINPHDMFLVFQDHGHMKHNNSTTSIELRVVKGLLKRNDSNHSHLKLCDP